MGLIEFIKTYFIAPILYDTGYNIYNTSIYALILVAAAWYIYKFLEWKKIKKDRYFVYSILPFVVFGSAFRVWEDAGLVQHWFFITPGSYIFTFALLVSAYGLSTLLKDKLKIDNWKTITSIGSLLALFALSGLAINQGNNLLWILSIFVGWVASIFLLEWKFKFGKDNASALSAHMLDASATFVGINLGYFEKHVLGDFFIGTFGASSFFLTKLAIVPIALWIISKYSEDKKQRNYLLFLVALLGLAPGLRSIFRIAMGV